MNKRLVWLVILVFITVTMLSVIQFFLLISIFNQDYENYEEDIYSALFEASYEINKTTLGINDDAQKSLNLELYNYYRLPDEELFQDKNINTESFPVIEERLIKNSIAKFLDPLEYNLDYEYGLYIPEKDSLLIMSSTEYSSELKKSVFTAPVFFKNVRNRVLITVYVKGLMKQVFMRNLFWYVSIFITLTAIIVLYILLYKEVLFQRKLSVMKEDFVANITHELKTPLSSSLLALKRLSKGDSTIEKEKQQKFIEIIYEENKKLDSLINKILDSSGIREDQFKLYRSDFRLKTSIEGIKKDFEDRVFEKKVVISLQSKANVKVLGDIKLFEMMVSSIIENSIQYSGEIVNISIKTEAWNKGVSLIIKDDGVGIPEEYMDSLFDKFFRVPTHKVHDTKGHGLGLFYVKSIVEKHEWQIDVSSKVGSGTMVCIDIPTKDIIN